MDLKSVNKVNVVDHVYEQMKDKIIKGEWIPNEKIPSENQLCKAFGVSRNTVRSAIQRLKTMGVIESKQGQGTFICDSVDKTFIDSFIPVIHLNNAEMIQMLEFRKTIEYESVKMAARRRDINDLKRIEKALNKMKKNKDDYKKFTMADFQFHLNIVRASKNSIFYRAILRLKDIILIHLEDINKDGQLAQSVKNHRMLYDAIKEKKYDLADLYYNKMEEEIRRIAELE